MFFMTFFVAKFSRFQILYQSSTTSQKASLPVYSEMQLTFTNLAEVEQKCGKLPIFILKTFGSWYICNVRRKQKWMCKFLQYSVTQEIPLNEPSLFAWMHDTTNAYKKSNQVYSWNFIQFQME